MQTMEPRHPAVEAVEREAARLQEAVNELEAVLQQGKRVDLAPLDDEVKTSLRGTMERLEQMHAAADYYRSRSTETRPPGVGGS